MNATGKKQAHLKVVGDEPIGDRSTPDDDFVPDLEYLFHRYSAYVAFIAHRLIGVPSDVDDVVQDVFLDVERGLSKLRDTSTVKSWLATITVRRSRRHLKKRRIRKFIGLDRSPSYENIADSSASPEHRAMIASIYKILDDFPVDERIAWTLKYVHEEKVSEVARLCGCSRATAHRRIASVQSVIRETMNE